VTNENIYALNNLAKLDPGTFCLNPDGYGFDESGSENHNNFVLHFFFVLFLLFSIIFESKQTSLSKTRQSVDTQETHVMFFACPL
jgi:hypothetical protein